MKTRLLLVLFTAVAAAQAQTNLLTNGSFESPALGSTQNFTGPFTFTGWSGNAESSGGNAGLVFGTDHGLAPQDGAQHFSFNGINPPAGTYIEQTFATTPGQIYTLSLYIGRNGEGGESLQLGTTVTDTNTTASIGSWLAVPPVGVAYGSQSWTFSAVGTTTTLRLTDTSGSNGNSDLFVDNVRVTAIPEPGAYAAVVGVLALGFVFSRRRTGAPKHTYL